MKILGVTIGIKPQGDSIEEMAEHIALSAKNAIDQCKTIWTNMGYSRQDIEEKQNGVLCHFEDFMQEIIAQEDRLFNAAATSVKNSRKVLEKLQHELQMDLVDLSEELPIITVEETYRRAAAKLQKEKELRLTKLHCLQETLESLCYRLGESQPDQIDVNNPTLETLEILQNEVEKKRQILDTRTTVCTNYMNEIKELANALEYTGKDETETNIVNQIFPLVMSKDIINRVKHLHEELKISHDDRLRALQQAYDMKIEELTKMWRICKISNLDRDLFLNRLHDKVSEQTQQKLDDELDRLKVHYRKYQTILSPLNKFEETLQYKEHLEDCRMTPARLINRGGVLLQEERQKKALIKHMQNMRHQIEFAVYDWENANPDDPVLLCGLPAKDYLEKYTFYQPNGKNGRLQRRHTLTAHDFARYV